MDAADAARFCIVYIRPISIWVLLVYLERSSPPLKPPKLLAEIDLSRYTKRTQMLMGLI